MDAMEISRVKGDNGNVIIVVRDVEYWNRRKGKKDTFASTLKHNLNDEDGDRAHWLCDQIAELLYELQDLVE